jgi:hypothetical protein
MENFVEIKENIVKQAIKKHACESQVERAKGCESWEELEEVIVDNIGWCSNNDIELPDFHYKTSQREFTLVNGRLNGEYKEYYHDGQLYAHCTYKEGKLHGEYKEWWENGQLREHYIYKEGEHHGQFKSWDYDGQLNVHCTYKDGEFHGEYKEWWSNGQLYEHSFYKEGEKNGKYYAYDYYGYDESRIKKYYTKGKVNKFRTFIFKHFNI